MLSDMGQVLEFSNRKQAALASGQPNARQYGTRERSIAVTARRLLSFALQVGWAGVSELLLPVAAAAMGATASELVADLEKCADEGLTLLHHVVRSRNANLVSNLAAWLRRCQRSGPWEFVGVFVRFQCPCQSELNCAYMCVTSGCMHFATPRTCNASLFLRTQGFETCLNSGRCFRLSIGCTDLLCCEKVPLS